MSGVRSEPQLLAARAFAAALEELRDHHNLSLRAIGRIMGVSHGQIRSYLDGKQEPGFFKVAALAEATGMSLDRLAGQPRAGREVTIDGLRYTLAGEATMLEQQADALMDVRRARRTPSAGRRRRVSRYESRSPHDDPDRELEAGD